jgi:hypothetical protein
MVKTTGKLYKKTRKKARLITNPIEIEKITGHYNPDAKPRCSLCKKPTVATTIDLGRPGSRSIEVGRYCVEHEIIFPLKKVVVSTY